MKYIYSFFCTLIVLLVATVLTSFVLVKSIAVKENFDSIPSRFQTKTEHVSYLKNGLKVAFPSVKPAQNQNATAKQNTVKIENEKLLTDVSIFPNPITDKLNVTYTVRKNTSV